MSAAVKTSCVNLASEVADVGVPSSALRSDLAVRPSGDGDAEHPLGGGCVGHGARRSSDRHEDVLLQGAVAGRVVGVRVCQQLPYDAAPSAAESAGGAGVVVAASDGAGVVVGGPGVVVAAAVGERVEGVAQPLVACPTKAGDLAFAGLERDRGLAGVAGECVARGVARAAVADLGQHRGCGDDASPAAEQREEDLAVGMLADRGGDLPLELLDLGDDRFKRRDQRATTARWAWPSSSPARPSGARRSLASSSLAGLWPL